MIMGKRYLYGAAVQGIQGFIFQTNELKDIVGASELVDMICTSAFDELISSQGTQENSSSIVRAAGNIKYIFDDEKLCAKVVREFPGKVQNMAPGITVSQAVVEYNENDKFEDAVDRLESRLRIQRNYPMRSNTWGMLGVRRSRKTGLPAVEEKQGEYLDLSTKCKRDKNNLFHVCKKAFGKERIDRNKLAFDVSELTKKNNWIAIIHADGNGLGKVIQKIGKDEKKLAEFSRTLDELTRAAAVESYKATVDEDKLDKDEKIPLRPVILSGDDLTVIIRGDLAMQYTETFLRSFERLTKEKMCGLVKEGKGLTACAGIAYIKSSYPFYYGYELAEMLCARAKKKAKEIDENLAPSCLMFHKVQDSFVEDYEEIVKRELLPCPGNSFEFGPYFLDKQKSYWEINKLRNAISSLDSEDGNAVRSHLRQWMSLMYRQENGNGQALQKKRRLQSLLEIENKEMLYQWVEDLTGKVERGDGFSRYPVYDVLSLYSIEYLITRK